MIKSYPESGLSIGRPVQGRLAEFQSVKSKEVEGKNRKEELKKTMRLFLAMLAIYLVVATVHSFRKTAAFTFPEPIGIVYFKEPTERLIAHEHYHLKQMQDEPWPLFYLKYAAGRGCIYEAEAGMPPGKHPVCELPWMKQPEPEQILSRKELLTWYYGEQSEMGVMATGHAKTDRKFSYRSLIR